MIVEHTQATFRTIQTIKTNDRVRSREYVRTYVDEWGDWLKVTKERILYDDESGTTGDVTLAKPVSAFEEIEIFYKITGNNKSVRIPVKSDTPKAILDFIYAGTSNIVIRYGASYII